MTSVDVAIIGAGPAGSTLGALLASRGISVALIDRDEFPRDKLCGEFLSYDALPILERLGVLPAIDAAGSPPIHHCRIVGRERTYRFDLPQPARGISRLFFDDLLLRTAIDRGAAPFTGHTATAVTASEVTLADGNVISARVVAGSWGRWGRFDSQLQRSFVSDQTHRSFGFKRHYRSSIGAHPTGTIELHSFRDGYLGVNDVEGGIVNICGLVKASRLEGHKGRWEAFTEMLRNEEPMLDHLYARHDPARPFLSSEPVIFRGRSAVEQGIFMIGDASGIVDPLTGNGMAMAIQSALLAGQSIARLLETPARRSSYERDYAAAHHQFFAPRIRWSRGAARLLSSPVLLNTALALHPPGRIGSFLLGRTRASSDAIQRLVADWF